MIQRITETYYSTKDRPIYIAERVETYIDGYKEIHSSMKSE